MNIICISKGSESKGGEFASALAGKLGYTELSRDELVEAAIKEGITVGRLETAMIKPQLINEKLLLEKEYYQAFATAMICERALAGNLLYHGRTGHLLLPGVTHVMKVRVVENKESAVEAAMARMNVSWEKARDYVEQVGEDVDRWVKTYYNIDWNQFHNFDLILNLDTIHVSNAATAMCAMAALPEFHGTPSTRKMIMDLSLAARTRVALARNDKTSGARFHVTADDGHVSIAYQPQDEKIAMQVPQAVSSVEGISELNCTMASSHILWIQERFDDNVRACDEVADLALKYNAAVEIVSYTSQVEAGEIAQGQSGAAKSGSKRSKENGGIEDEVAEAALSEEDARLRKVYERLVIRGVAGGTKIVSGPTNHLLDSLDARVSYFFVIVGDLFMGKGHEARVRMTRDLSRSLSESLHAPVVGLNELHKTFMFGPRQVVQLVVTLVLAAALFALTFWFQIPILEFFREAATVHRAISAVLVALFVPLFAYLYGTFARNVLKLVKME